MLGYQQFFVFVAKAPKMPGEIHPHFPVGPKMDIVKIKNETCHTEDLIKRLKNIKTPM